MAPPKLPAGAKQFGDWVRRMREAKGMTKVDLQVAAGYADANTVWRMEESGAGITSLPTMHKLAVGLDLDLGYLLHKAGYVTESRRFDNFDRSEKAALQWAFTTATSATPRDERLTSIIRELSDELAESVLNQLPGVEPGERKEEVQAHGGDRDRAEGDAEEAGQAA